MDYQAFTIDATIGGYAATQEGNYLIGAADTPVEGLKIEYLGGGTGSRGTVSYTRGMASVLDNMLGSFLESKGVFATRTKIINEDIADINAQRDRLEERLEAMEERYYSTFNALDTMIANMQSTSQYLTQQLASLPKISKPSAGW